MSTRLLVVVVFGLLAAVAVVLEERGRAVAGAAGGWATRLPLALAAGMRTTAGRTVTLLVWWWLGWHFLVR